MAAHCAVCGQEEFLPFRCKLCSQPHCLDHRLPENHACPNLASFRERTRERGAGMLGARTPAEAEADAAPLRVRGPSPLTEAGRRLGSFAGRSRSHLLLAAVLLTFAFQVAAGLALGALLDPGFLAASTGDPGLLGGYLLVQCALALGACAPFASQPWGLLEKPWAVLTNLFAHAGPFHLLFNAIFLYFFARELERRVGAKAMTTLFFAAGILAAFGQVLLFGGAVLGASGALMGVLGALTVLAPTMRVMFWFFPLPLWVMTLIFVVFDVGGLVNPVGGVANLAHLLGLGLGVAWGFHLKQRGVMPRVASTWASQRRMGRLGP